MAECAEGNGETPTNGDDGQAGPARRGPKTPAGKAAVRLNAVRHGLGVTSPVIPGVEDPSDWDAHRMAMLASLAPEGHLETVLAERIALTEWRLRRVTKFETAQTLAQRLLTTDEADPDRLLPHPVETDRIVRYEAHLSRLFYQALHELEAQQERRRGQAAPLARVDVHGVADG